MRRELFASSGFTLIELLIVVAIIAILAAIAVPNFLEAQVRAKASRTRGELRTFATLMEAYAADQNDYPPIAIVGTVLTTPVAYATSVAWDDPFGVKRATGPFAARPVYGYALYKEPLFRASIIAGVPLAEDRQKIEELRWSLAGRGPDSDVESEDASIDYADITPASAAAYMARLLDGTMCYDPTNGSISDGDILRTQKGEMRASARE